VVIEWKKGKEGGGQEGGTGESDKGREIVYEPEKSINECKTGENGVNYNVFSCILFLYIDDMFTIVLPVLYTNFCKCSLSNF
jgi:hypothetical protein